MMPRAACLGLIVGILILANLHAGEVSARPTIDAAQPPPFLNVTANFAGWTWFGTGAPCERGGNLTFVAHLFGNATGGRAPYFYSWNFGDGSKDSTLQNATHVFLTNQDEWAVNLTATDSAVTSGMASIHVSPPAFSCPAEQSTVASPWPLLLVAIFLPATAITVVVSIVLLWTRILRRR